MGVVQLISAVSSIIAGLLILILWIMAANDQGEEDGTRHKCRGCFYYYHDDLMNGGGDTNTWYRNHRDSYPILIAFGVICGVFWMATGGIGFVVSSEMMAKIYIGAGVMTYTTFVVLFAIIADRVKYAASHAGCYGHCTTNNDWFIKHQLDSTREFWGAALACFALGAFQIIGAIYVYATLGSPDPPSADSMKPAANPSAAANANANTKPAPAATTAAPTGSKPNTASSKPNTASSKPNTAAATTGGATKTDPKPK